ncbi:MAG TPA: arylsulfatase [Solibacterales bacterium]|nr:arylsulfatase [Bryobacterales bacterium]
MIGIKRRTFLQALGAATRKRPNILLLMTDQHRADCLGAAGNRVIRTPHLDQLASEGALFRHAYSSTPTCTPARAALLTGQSPWRHGMLGYAKVAERYPVEMPRLLREAGYHTTGIGKMHWSPMRNLHGFHQTILDEHHPMATALTRAERSDYESWFQAQMPGANPYATGLEWNDYRARAYVFPEALHPTVWTADTAVRFLNAYSQPNPFFLKVSFVRPHSPYDPPERYLRKYRDADLPPALRSDWSGRYARRSGESNEPWHGDFGPDVVRSSRQGYYALVSQIDDQIGRIMEALHRRRLLDETLIAMISDHGDMLGDHNLWRKSYAYESSARIPFVVRPPRGFIPGFRGGRVFDQPVEIRDVLPTFLDAASAAIPEPVDGKSVLTLLRSPNAPWREFIDLEHDVCYSPANHWNALTDGRRKYIFHAPSGEEQFFDLERDPGETVNITDPGQVRPWRARLAQHLQERGEAWVRNGALVPRPASQLLSPHYPAA